MEKVKLFLSAQIPHASQSNTPEGLIVPHTAETLNWHTRVIGVLGPAEVKCLLGRLSGTLSERKRALKWSSLLSSVDARLYEVEVARECRETAITGALYSCV
jgi:hypothetical protein